MLTTPLDPLITCSLWSYPLSPTEQYHEHLARITAHIQAIFNNNALVINTNTLPAALNGKNDSTQSSATAPSQFSNEPSAPATLSSASLNTTPLSPSTITTLNTTGSNTLNPNSNANDNYQPTASNQPYIPSTQLHTLQQNNYGAIPSFLQSHNRTCTIWSQREPTVAGKGGGCLTPKTALLPHHKDWLSHQTQQPNLLMPITCPLTITTNTFFTTYLSNDYDNVFMTIPYCPDTAMLHDLQLNTDIRDVKQLTYNLLRQHDLTTPSTGGSSMASSVLPQILPPPSSLPLHYIENYIRTVTGSLGGELVKYDRKMLGLLMTMNELHSSLIQTFTVNKDLMISLPMMMDFSSMGGVGGAQTTSAQGGGNAVVTIGQVMTENKLTNTIVVEIELLHFNQINIDPLIFHALFHTIHPDGYKMMWRYANTPFGPSRMYSHHDLYLNDRAMGQTGGQSNSLIAQSSSDDSGDDDNDSDDPGNSGETVNMTNTDDLSPISPPNTSHDNPTQPLNGQQQTSISTTLSRRATSTPAPTVPKSTLKQRKQQRQHSNHYKRQCRIIQHLLTTVHPNEHRRLYAQFLLPDTNPYGGSGLSALNSASGSNNRRGMNSGSGGDGGMSASNDGSTSVLNLKNDYTYQLYGKRLEEYGWYQNRLITMVQRGSDLRRRQSKSRLDRASSSHQQQPDSSQTQTNTNSTLFNAKTRTQHNDLFVLDDESGKGLGGTRSVVDTNTAALAINDGEGTTSNQPLTRYSPEDYEADVSTIRTHKILNHNALDLGQYHNGGLNSSLRGDPTLIDPLQQPPTPHQLLLQLLPPPPPLRTALTVDDFIHGVCILPQMTTLFLQYRLNPIVFHPEHLALMYTQLFLHPHETTV